MESRRFGLCRLISPFSARPLFLPLISSAFRERDAHPHASPLVALSLFLLPPAPSTLPARFRSSSHAFSLALSCLNPLHSNDKTNRLPFPPRSVPFFRFSRVTSFSQLFPLPKRETYTDGKKHVEKFAFVAPETLNADPNFGLILIHRSLNKF